MAISRRGQRTFRLFVPLLSSFAPHRTILSYRSSRLASRAGRLRVLDDCCVVLSRESKLCRCVQADVSSRWNGVLDIGKRALILTKALMDND